MSPLLYYVIFLKISLSSIIHLIYLISSFFLSFLYTKDNPTLEYHSYRPKKNAPTPIYPQNIQVTLSEGNRPPPNFFSKLVNKNTLLNLNIASYFLNILASLDVYMWFATGGPIKNNEISWPNKTSTKDSRKNVAYGY